MASSDSGIANMKTFCIVTGASRGIGRAIAIAFSSKFAADSVTVLTGRSVTALNETQRLVQAAAPGVHCKVVIADHSDENSISSSLCEITKDINPAEFQQSLLIHNAASLDLMRYARQMNASDVSSLQKFCMLNMTSALLLTSHYLHTFPFRDGARRVIVNMSSIAGVGPYPCSSVYCMGKAGRHMLFRTIALEEPDIRVLSYDPDLVDTEMFHDLCTNTANPDTKEWLENVKVSQQLLKPEQVASMLLSILEKDDYESGAHISYSEEMAKTDNKMEKK